jgi:hypothetical protein
MNISALMPDVRDWKRQYFISSEVTRIEDIDMMNMLIILSDHIDECPYV